MLVEQDRLFLLPAPVCLMLLAAMVIGCQRFLHRQSIPLPKRAEAFLPAIAFSFLLAGAGLVLQALMDEETFLRSGLLLATLNLGAVFSLHVGICCRYEIHGHREAALGVIALLLVGCVVVAELQSSLNSRMAAVGTGMAIILCLPVPQLLRKIPAAGMADRLLALSFCFGAGFAVLRACWLVWVAPAMELADLPLTPQWRMYVLLLVFFKAWFALVVLFAALGDLYGQLCLQRDTDPLSGLLNRRGFQEQALIRLLRHPGTRWFVIAVDIDHFKHINDSFGHHIGDEVIGRLGGLLSTVLLPGQIAARPGGEEFTLLVDAPSLASAVALAEDLRRSLAQAHWSGLPAVTASFGVEQVADAEDLPVALRRADRLLYEAKARGRNRVSWARTALPASPRSSRAEGLRHVAAAETLPQHA